MAHDKSLALSYLSLRKIIGFLGFAFPFILALGALIIYETGIQGSISSYYHTGMRDVFVGILCVIGVFLFSYRGFEKPDNIAGYLGGIFAIGVALFPTTPEGEVTSNAELIGFLHSTFAALFFLTLIYFSLFLFTKTDPSITPSRRKHQRNKVYKACGYIMAICIVLVAIYSFLPSDTVESLAKYKPVFWLEAIAVLAFGISWSTKGEAILKDEV